MNDNYENKKTTAPVPSAATDGEQPSGKNPTKSIADEPGKNKTDEEIMREHLRAIQRINRMNDPSYLHTVFLLVKSNYIPSAKKSESIRFTS